MFDALLPLLQKPALWRRTAEPFWDDEHISKGMLEAHLDPDWDAASRKHSTIDRSVEWLAGLVPAQGKILDLGCGPGLYAKRLSDRGYAVTGMDCSRRSIAYARSLDAKTEYIYQDYLQLDETGRFDAVTLIYGDFAALTPDERRTLIPKVRRALKPGGLFILDVFTEKRFAKKSGQSSWALCETGGYWSADPYVCLTATYLYENGAIAVDQHIVIQSGGIKEYLIWDTAYSVESLTGEVSPFGFRVSGIFGDVCGGPYTDASETLCFVLKRGAE